MADNAPNTPAAPTATFDVAVWLSRFESVGGNYLATESQTSFCLACDDMAPGQSPAHAMLRELTDQQRAEVVAHIRARAGLSPTSQEKTQQPDLNAIPLEKLSEPAGNAIPSSGQTLDHESEGSQNMDMTHAFAPALTTQRPKDWDSALAEYEAAQACSNALRESNPLSDAARDACCDALDHLIENVRAPSLEALSYKIGLSQKHWEAWARPGEWLQAFRADLASLAKPALSAASCTKLDLADNSAADETERNSWDQLFKAYQTAKAAEDTYDADVWSPAQKRQNEFEEMVGIHGHTHETGEKRRALMAKFPNEYVPHDVNEEMDRLQGRRIDLEHALMDMPAPDLDALRWKLSLRRQMSEGHLIEPEIFDTILAELDRLFGKQPESDAIRPDLSLPNGGFAAAAEAWTQARKAVEAHRGDSDIPDDLSNAETKAWKTMLNTPAPDLVALRFKLEQLLHIEPAVDAIEGRSGDEVLQTLADIARLMNQSSAQANVFSPCNDDTNFWALVRQWEAVEAIPSEHSTDTDIDQTGALMRAIMACKAPDPAATKWKLDYVLADSCFSDDYIVPIRAEYDHWLNVAAQSGNAGCADLTAQPDDWDTAFAAAKRAEAGMRVAYDAQNLAENAYMAALPADVAPCFSGRPVSPSLTEGQEQTVHAPQAANDLTAAERSADAAGNVFYAALEDLFAVPAPNLSNVLEKMELAHQHGEELNAFTHVMGDLRRLIGGIAITGEQRMAA